MRRYLRLVDQPVEVGARSIGRIAGEPFGLDVEALLGALYLRAYDSVSDARASLGHYLDFYNSRRPHSSLDGMTPDQAYFPPLPLRLAA